MGSVRHRLSEARHDCNVVLIGDSKVGKSALVYRFINNKFSEGYRATSFEKLTTSALVANRRVKYTIWDTTGSRTTSGSAARDLSLREADVFMLCYKISDPSTLFSALNFWCPEVRAIAPDTPIILVGCQSDLRGDRDVITHLGKSGRAPVSSDQALSFSRQISAVIYVETSSKTSSRSAISAFEVAGLASMGKITPKVKAFPSRVPSTPSPEASMKKQRFSGSPRGSLDRQETDLELLHSIDPAEHFWDQFQSPNEKRRSTSEAPAAPAQAQATNPAPPRTPSLSSSSRSASLSSAKSRARSNTSIPSSLSASSVFGSKTPKSLRKTSSSSANANSQEKMITIKCQRLRPDKTYEEIEVEVPAPIYETIQLYNDTGSLAARKDRSSSRSFGAKLKNLFTKN